MVLPLVAQLVVAQNVVAPMEVPLPPPPLAASCPVALQSRPSASPAALEPAFPADQGEPAAVDTASGSVPAGDYRQRLATTALGWPRLDRWCVWVEPVGEDPAAALFERRWLEAVEAALKRWRELLPIQRVSSPEAAQVRILRRRPPLRREDDGRTRASHGRASLEVREVNRQGEWRLEPQVDVLISPGQRALATEATALHELGHAFGLWGHSDDPADAMGAVPGAQPVLRLSGRDRATLRWLYGQPTRFGAPLPAAERSRRS